MNKFTCLELDMYYNHKAIREEKISPTKPHIVNKSVGYYGNYFKASLMPLPNSEIEMNSIKFKFPNHCEDKYDNIECNSQTINFLPKRYNKVSFIACNSNNTYEEFIFNFADGSSKTTDFYIMDWGYAGTYKAKERFEFDEVFFKDQACDIILRVKNTNDVSVACTYLEYLITCNKELKSITLPENKQVHIFAITLQESDEEIM